MKKKLIISLIAVILVLGVAFAIGALVKEKDTLQDMIIRIESAIKEVLGDDVKKQTETVVAGTLKYADKEGNEINYGTQRAAISMQICRKGYSHPCLSLNGKRSTPLSAGREQRNIPS